MQACPRRSWDGAHRDTRQDAGTARHGNCPRSVLPRPACQLRSGGGAHRLELQALQAALDRRAYAHRVDAVVPDLECTRVRASAACKWGNVSAAHVLASGVLLARPQATGAISACAGCSQSRASWGSPPHLFGRQVHRLRRRRRRRRRRPSCARRRCGAVGRWRRWLRRAAHRLHEPPRVRRSNRRVTAAPAAARRCCRRRHLGREPDCHRAQSEIVIHKACLGGYEQRVSRSRDAALPEVAHARAFKQQRQRAADGRL